MTIQLSPTQQAAFDGLFHALPLSSVFRFWGTVGSGKTTVLRALHSRVGGAFLTMQDIPMAMQSRHPLALEESFTQVVLDAFAHNETVIIDDMHLLEGVVNGCGSYPRAGFLEASLSCLANYAQAESKKLILCGTGSHALGHRSFPFGIGEFSPADYAVLVRVHLGSQVECLDFDEIFRFAPKLNAHQLRAASVWLQREPDLTTSRFVEYLQSQYLASNVDLGEVQAIRLEDLKGVDEVIESLRTNIILPLENVELATELALKPKRGVLLAGPPGTGKTSVGRALAHRLKSKFFLVDGTVISGTNYFYHHISHLFEQAKLNAPSIIFIDDSDAIFESGEELGLYRYLLTMLDGLESASAGRVCVMLTAMDISHLPPALIRSGRIELWLDMKLPDSAARAEIMSAHVASVSALRGQVDLQRLANETDGFTGADLKRLMEDGKLLLAHDMTHGLEPKPITEYFVTAAQTVRQNKERCAEAEERARRQRPQQLPFYDLANNVR